MKPRNVLCIDNADTCQLYESLFSTLGKNIAVTCASEPDEAVRLVKTGGLQLVVLEPHGHGFDGIELCRIISRTDVSIPIIIYSGMGRESDRIEGLTAGASAYLVKPADMDKFIETVKEFLN